MYTKDEFVKGVNNSKTFFKTDNYSMSIGELKNLFEAGELKINPDFQRLFRWTHDQKVKLIESVLMGIPIPPIFVYEDADGVWELVDGLQRVATLLQCMGVLKFDGEKYETLILGGTKYIPEMDGFSWDDTDENSQIPDTLKLNIRRSKINVVIIKNESDKNAKFEVFQRLNTGGSNASNQEVRNNVMIMNDKSTYDWFDNLSGNSYFNESIAISEKLEMEQYHKELLLRFIALTFYDYDSKKDVSDFLDDISSKLISLTEVDKTKYERIFKKTFELICKALGDKAFKKNQKGKFLESGFEAVAVGLAKNISNYSEDDIEELKSKISSIYDQPFYYENAGSGSNAKSRIQKLVPNAVNYFAK